MLTKIVKAKSNKIVLLKIEYANEIPNEAFTTNAYSDTQTISLNLSPNDTVSIIDTLTNPNTGNFYLLWITIILIISGVAFIILKRKKTKYMILILGASMIIPATVYALCKYDISINSNITIDKPITCESFADDDWSTISQNIKDGNTSCYNVGDTKNITLEGYGDHLVRIANMSTPDECSSEGFSQTACGFVLEFTDIITKHVMTPNNFNTGGWTHSSMRTFVNEDIFNLFPEELKEITIDTTVVSGHGAGISANHITTDKLYLLTHKEIFNGINSSIRETDTSDDYTRQLDYYNNLGITANVNYRMAIKLYNGVDTAYWQRSAVLSGTAGFFLVQTGGWTGCFVGSSVYSEDGVSPAFRIG